MTEGWIVLEVDGQKHEAPEGSHIETDGAHYYEVCTDHRCRLGRIDVQRGEYAMGPRGGMKLRWTTLGQVYGTCLASGECNAVLNGLAGSRIEFHSNYDKRVRWSA